MIEQPIRLTASLPWDHLSADRWPVLAADVVRNADPKEVQIGCDARRFEFELFDFQSSRHGCSRAKVRCSSCPTETEGRRLSG
jgi:hypothetical protein